METLAMFPDSPLTIGQCTALACLWEATASKPGNVYRAADFSDMTYADLVTSAAVISPVMEAAPEERVGRTILNAVRATQTAVGKNTNLGTILLLAPLAKVPRSLPVRQELTEVLQALDVRDARETYQAIRLARPGGLGHSDEFDVRDEPQVSLMDAMRAAAARDLIASQYAHQFTDVLDLAVPWLAEGLAQSWPLNAVIVHVQLRLMREFPDSLIARKCGPQIAREASDRAAQVLAAGPPSHSAYQDSLTDLDFWLRADAHRRNPGTTADLIAAGLFAALRQDVIRLPVPFY